MATFTLTITVNKTGAELAALLSDQSWNNGKVYVRIKSKGGPGGAGAGPTNGGGGNGYAEWGTLAGFATDGVDLGSVAANDSITFLADDPDAVSTTLTTLAGAYLVHGGTSTGTAGDDGISSDIAPTLGHIGGTGGASGVTIGGGGGGGAGTANSDGANGSDATISPGIGGSDGDSVGKGGDGGGISQAGFNATNGGGGGAGTVSSSPGTGTAGYVKITGTIAAGSNNSGMSLGLKKGLTSVTS